MSINLRTIIWYIVQSYKIN